MIKLLIDEDLSPWAAAQLRGRGVDAVHVRERNMLGTTDVEVLRRAFDEDRILVTANVVDFRRLAAQWEVHPGVILVGDGNLKRSEQLSILEHVVARLEAEPQDGPGLVNRALTVFLDGREEVEDLGG